MYGQNEYGTLQYAADSQAGTMDEYYVDLTKLVPEFVTESFLMFIS